MLIQVPSKHVMQIQLRWDLVSVLLPLRGQRSGQLYRGVIEACRHLLALGLGLRPPGDGQASIRIRSLLLIPITA